MIHPLVNASLDILVNDPRTAGTRHQAPMSWWCTGQIEAAPRGRDRMVTLQLVGDDDCVATIPGRQFPSRFRRGNCRRTEAPCPGRAVPQQCYRSVSDRKFMPTTSLGVSVRRRQPSETLLSWGSRRTRTRRLRAGSGLETVSEAADRQRRSVRTPTAIMRSPSIDR